MPSATTPIENSGISLRPLPHHASQDGPSQAGHQASPSASTSVSDTDRRVYDTGLVVPSTESARLGQRSVVQKSSRLAQFWHTYIRCTVDISGLRDHLAVERTFLGYLRTSTALAMLGTVVAQIFTIQPQDNGLPHVSIDKPLATVFFGLAVVTVLLGAIRTFRHQSLLTNGKALAGGFEIHMIGLAFLSLLLACFGITLAMDNLPLANSV